MLRIDTPVSEENKSLTLDKSKETIFSYFLLNSNISHIFRCFINFNKNFIIDLN